MVMTVPNASANLYVCFAFCTPMYKEGIIRLWHHNCILGRGMDPSALASSVVNWICGSMLLICSRNLSFFAESMTTQVSSHMSLPNSWRIFSCVNGLGLRILHIEVGHIGAGGRPHGCSLQLFKEPALELEISGLQTNLQ